MHTCKFPDCRTEWIIGTCHCNFFCWHLHHPDWQNIKMYLCLYTYICVYVRAWARALCFMRNWNEKNSSQMVIAWTDIAIVTKKTGRKRRPWIAIPSTALKSSKMNLILLPTEEVVLTCKVNFVSNKIVNTYLYVQMWTALLAISVLLNVVLL